ncbi:MULTISPECIES: hypothetical protein [Exiguobacterium]|uniref:hypothetical protein n=1 Tax=Exiguobacterium TaxID=33986 RepID=UPI001BE67E26|nr:MULTISPECIES: hypothetical protein [Exiguobacterium]MCT4776681.1 hypothetical protein [Exiguobacterium aquaticum]MCT4788712.1 hypothetical protein [Exiguobacterium mexicanum]
MNLGNTLSIIAIILVIPLGVITNLVTPRIVNFYSNYSERSRVKRVSNLMHELNERRKLKENLSKLISFGLISVLRILLLSTISAFFLYLFQYFSLISSQLQNGLLPMIYAMSMLINYYIAILATRDFKVLNQVYEFEKFEAKLKKNINRLEKNKN